MAMFVEKKSKRKKKNEVVEMSEKVKGLKESIDSLREEIDGFESRLAQMQL